MKGTKQRRNLERRQKDYDSTMKAKRAPESGFRRPGSNKK